MFEGIHGAIKNAQERTNCGSGRYVVEANEQDSDGSETARNSRYGETQNRKTLSVGNDVVEESNHVT
jgi:hypothetical protein